MSLPFSSSPNPLLILRHHTHLISLPPFTKPQHRTAHNSKTLKLHANSSTTSPPPPAGQPTPTAAANTPFRTRPPSDVTVLTVGSTGYIGNFVVRELCSRGFNVVAVARDRSGIRGRDGRDQTLRRLSPASVCFSDVTDPESLNSLALPPIDVVVCCLASRNGGIKDSWRVDYSAALNALSAARRRGATHFVLLSAVCVQKPLLEFQRAKLKLEAALAAEAAADPNFTYSVVRPTAFFKSLGGQVNLVKSGYPYVVFGDGNLCACKPISEEDLAAFIADCIFDEDKSCRVLPVGGPGAALTPLEQGEMLFRLLGREPRFVKVPIGVMDFAIGAMEVLARAFPALEDAVEFARIGRYYATESMLVMDEETGEYSAERTPSYGRDTLEDFFTRVIRDGMEGQELGEQSIF